jgi:hypothetical protein
VLDAIAALGADEALTVQERAIIVEIDDGK